MFTKTAILLLCVAANTAFAKRELNQVVLPAQPVLAPGIAPSQPVAVLPVVETPAQQPTAETVLPVLLAPAPETVLPVVTVAPVPAPVTPASPPPMVPAPAPVVTPVPAPAPAPLMMAPAPAPISPPLCGVMPQCRLFVEDQLCCENVGALTSQQHAVMKLQCTHAVNYSPKCFNVTGPSNMTAFNQFDDSMRSRYHMAQVNFLDAYIGNVSIDIEGPRTNASLSADCGLYITPCLFDGQLVSKVAPVLGTSFTTIDAGDFLDVSSSLETDINNLDSLVFPNLYYPQACQQQNVGALNATFFRKDWVTYTTGFTNKCNYTAFVDAMPPSMAMSGTAASLG